MHCAARIVRRHIDICRPAWTLADAVDATPCEIDAASIRHGRNEQKEPERGKLHRKREEPEARAREADASQKFGDARPVAVVFSVTEI